MNEHDYSKLLTKFKKNILLMTNLFILEHDKNIETDSDTLSIILSAYMSALFCVLDTYSQANKNLEKSTGEVKQKLKDTLKSISFLNIEDKDE
jgi:hypothetical protein